MVPNAYDFWLLDLDGTLVDVEDSYRREVFDAVGDRLGRSFTDRQTEVLWHGIGGDRSDVLSEWGVDPERFWEVFDAIDDPVERAEASYLYDDAHAVAAIDGPTGLVTHCPARPTAHVLEHLDIRDWFDGVVCCDDEVGFKPDPRPVRAAMAKLGIWHNGRDGVLVGDGWSDLVAATNAGLDGVHVERHAPDQHGYCEPHGHCVSGFDELLR